MTTLLLNDDGDLDFKNGNFVRSLNNSDKEIEQRLKTRLRLFLGEWFLDTNLGIPYLQMVFIKGTDPELIESYFKDEILNTEGVSTLINFSPIGFNPRTRIMTISFAVMTINDTELEVTL